MSAYLAIKVNDTDYEYFKVDDEVYYYVRQLENAINFEETKQNLAQLYPNRFNNESRN